MTAVPHPRHFLTSIVYLWVGTAVLVVVNEEPQIAALCWFLDVFPHDDQWDFFSLAEGHGLLWEAAKEFDMLLPSVPES